MGKRRSAVSEKRGVGDHARIKKRLQNLFKATKTDFTDSGNISHITKTKKKNCTSRYVVIDLRELKSIFQARCCFLPKGNNARLGVEGIQK